MAAVASIRTPLTNAEVNDEVGKWLPSYLRDVIPIIVGYSQDIWVWDDISEMLNAASSDQLPEKVNERFYPVVLTNENRTAELKVERAYTCIIGALPLPRGKSYWEVKVTYLDEFDSNIGVTAINRRCIWHTSKAKATGDDRPLTPCPTKDCFSQREVNGFFPGSKVRKHGVCPQYGVWYNFECSSCTVFNRLAQAVNRRPTADKTADRPDLPGDDDDDDRTIRNGSVVGVLVDMDAGNLYYYVDGRFAVFAVSGMDTSQPLYPCVAIHNHGTTITFVPNPVLPEPVPDGVQPVIDDYKERREHNKRC